MGRRTGLLPVLFTLSLGAGGCAESVIGEQKERALRQKREEASGQCPVGSEQDRVGTLERGPMGGEQGPVGSDQGPVGGKQVSVVGE